MPSLASINPKRAWLLFAAIWLPLITFYWWPRVEHSWYESNRVRERINRAARDQRFQECAKSVGVNWLLHVQRYKFECQNEAQRICGGDRLCATALLTDGCLKSKVRGCEGLALLVAGDGSDPELSDHEFRVREERERLIFYFGRTFSNTLYESLAWAMGPLVALPLIPGAVRRLWRWLAKKPSA